MFVQLIDKILIHLEVSEDTFLSFNSLDLNDEIFDEFYYNQRDLGKIIRLMADVIGRKEICGILTTKMK